MVVQIPTIDTGGQIGQGIGQGLAGLGQQYYASQALKNAVDNFQNQQDQSPLGLYSYLQDQLKFVPGGARLATQLQPLLQQSAQRQAFNQVLGGQGGQQGMPQQGMQGQQMSIPNQQQMALSQSPGLQMVTGVTPGGQQQVQQANQSPAAMGAIPPAFQALMQPETQQTTTAAEQQAQFREPPPFRAQDYQQDIARLVNTGVPYTEAVDAAKQKHQQNVIDPLLNLRKQAELQEDRIKQGESTFNDIFNQQHPNADSELKGMARSIYQSYATGTDKNGRPYSPRAAADKAIKDYNKIQNAIDQYKKTGKKTFTEAAFKSLQQERLRRLKPGLDIARKHGIEKYLFDVTQEGDILGRSEAALSLFPPSEGLAKRVSHLPDISGRVGIFPTRQRDIQPRKVAQGIKQLSQIIEETPQNTSLIGLRALAYDKGYDEADFQAALDLAMQNGFEMSDLHEEQSQYLQEPVQFSFSDLWLGRVRNASQFFRNMVLKELN